MNRVFDACSGELLVERTWLGRVLDWESDGESMTGPR